LVVTGYLGAETRFQLGLLAAAAAAGGIKKYQKVLVKPHPSSPIQGILPPPSTSFPWEATTQALEYLWKGSDVVFLANSTSASLEAAWLGLPTILAASVDSINLSPMLQFADAAFVATPDELMIELKDPRRIVIEEDYYLLDADLPRWKALLSKG
jgi:surface carbohydrate biosynthesis protein (TIGR04326 family)